MRGSLCGRELSAAFQRSALTPAELWVRYLALGGSAGIVETEAYLFGATDLGPHQHDVLALALNEYLSEVGQEASVPYFTA